ncbi:MAG TPA: hypothetical protein QGF58_15260, partial [Myxococcota bacterium]|nr:hypothetical protein [Myxococcota bacterium]
MQRHEADDAVCAGLAECLRGPPVVLRRLEHLSEAKVERGVLLELGAAGQHGGQRLVLTEGFERGLEPCQRFEILRLVEQRTLPRILRGPGVAQLRVQATQLEA